ncbi:MAG TPA: hypothetical protein P5550_07070 [Bacteroidales bacterium]|nr:hypothetical protein [Bacteroidales bacterium]HRZ77797.1 hypothetical protein [Bacteroidales bacterium]
MKIAVLFAVLGIMLSASPIAQQRIEVGPNYPAPGQALIRGAIGDTLLLRQGGILLVDTALFHTLEAIADALDQGDLHAASLEALQASERRIAECEAMYLRLKENCEREHALAATSLQRTREGLDLLTLRLETTRNHLDAATSNLEAATTHLKRAGRPSLWQGILIGAAGVGLGALISR